MNNPLKEWRGDRTQEEASKLLDVDAMTFSRWERGLHLPRKRHWPKIKDVTGIAPSTLADFVDVETEESAQ